MKSLFLAFFMLSAAAPAFALYCRDAWVDPFSPCTPNPGKETDSIKKKILAAISDAQAMETKVKELEVAYRTVRENKKASAQMKLDALEPYFAKKNEQDKLYEYALGETMGLYRVDRALNARTLTIGEPAEAAVGYMAGLTARWKPQVTDSGPGVKLAVRIKGSDGHYRYGGRVSMDPGNPKQVDKTVALTLKDGRVLIFKELFKIALRTKNPGILGSALYHEVNHFNRLSWKDKSGKNRSWASPEESERDAYADEASKGHIFGLSDEHIIELEEQSLKKDADVKSGKISSWVEDPVEQEKWRKYYESDGVAGQINLEDEYAALRAAVEEPLRRQREEQRLAREKRERQARQVEDERLARERAELAAIQERDLAAAACGYRPAYQGNTGIFLGFKDDNDYLFFNLPLRVPINMNDLRVAFLVARACEDVRSRAAPRACNDAARILSRHAAQSDFAAKLDYMLGSKRRDDCINHVFDQAGGITDSASFEKVISKYHKQKEKERREYDKRWRSSPPRSEKPDRQRPPRDNERTPTDPDHDDVRRRIGGPFKP